MKRFVAVSDRFHRNTVKKMFLDLMSFDGLGVACVACTHGRACRLAYLSTSQSVVSVVDVQYGFYVRTTSMHYT